MKNGIVIPCYNEAGRLKFDEFRAFLVSNTDYLLCFVNDGSQDATLDQLLEFKKENPNQVRVVDLLTNMGKAEAVRSGMQDLLAATGVTQLGFMDADLATDFVDYQRLSRVQQLEKKHMVIGSRKMGKAQSVDRSSFRKLASAIVGWVINLIISMPIKDTQCGAKVFDRATAAYLFRASFLSRWLFDVEIFIRMNKLYGSQVMNKVSEVALLNWTEVEGSKISLKESLKFPIELVEIAFAYKVIPHLQLVRQSWNMLIYALKKWSVQ